VNEGDGRRDPLSEPETHDELRRQSRQSGFG
jgi:hypothetical protein